MNFTMVDCFVLEGCETRKPSDSRPADDSDDDDDDEKGHDDDGTDDGDGDGRDDSAHSVCCLQ